jgi:Mn-dependent DtxR family transcriptional regulator
MLAEILSILDRGKTVSVQEVSAVLSIEPKALIAGLEYLERNGYVKKIGSSVHLGKFCRGCARCAAISERPSAWAMIRTHKKYT